MEDISTWINVMATIATVTAAWAAVRTLSIQTSPDLMLFVEPDQNSSSALRLVMRNNGEAAAYNVSFRLNKTLFPSDESFIFEAADRVFSQGYAILPPHRERDILLGDMRDIIPLWGDEVYEVTVTYSVKWGGRSETVVCPVEIGSYKSQITISQEKQIDRDAKRAFRSISQMDKSLRSITEILRDHE